MYTVTERQRDMGGEGILNTPLSCSRWRVGKVNLYVARLHQSNRLKHFSECLTAVLHLEIRAPPKTQLIITMSSLHHLLFPFSFIQITVNVWRCFDRLFSSHKDRFPSKTTTHCAGASMKACFCLLDIGCRGATLFCPWRCQLNMKQWDYKWWSSGAFLSQLLTTTNCWCINHTPIISTKQCVTLCGIHKKCVASGSSIILHSDILDIKIWAPLISCSCGALLKTLGPVS